MGCDCDLREGLLSQNHSHKVCGAVAICKRCVCEGQILCLRGVNVALTNFCSARAFGFGFAPKMLYLCIVKTTLVLTI